MKLLVTDGQSFNSFDFTFYQTVNLLYFTRKQDVMIVNVPGDTVQDSVCHESCVCKS